MPSQSRVILSVLCLVENYNAITFQHLASIIIPKNIPLIEPVIARMVLNIPNLLRTLIEIINKKLPKEEKRLWWFSCVL